jgi:uncharacterized phage protein (TIGR02220 family)
MRHDLKIRKLIRKYGLKGYGLYNLIIESITENLSTNNPIPELEETCDDIAELYNENSTEINEIACFLINIGLLETHELTTKLTCSKIYKFIEASQTRSESIRNMIKSYKNTAESAVYSSIPEKTQNTTNVQDKSDMSGTFVKEKNKKRIRKEKEKEYIYSTVLDYLNSVVGSKYRNNETNRRFIKARINDGYNIDDFKQVIDIKYQEWKNTDFAQYLRPRTLFGTKFEQYINQKMPVSKNESNDKEKPDYSINSWDQV